MRFDQQTGWPPAQVDPELTFIGSQNLRCQSVDVSDLSVGLTEQFGADPL
jgi:hypothetical protein